ncbi:MAG: CdaR family protein, partial [bacterium]|nr:CdaR family protein [bacterium]
DKSHILLPRKIDVDILNVVEPKAVEVVVEKLHSKKVPVQSRCELETVPGYTIVGDIQLKPDSVIITGPISALKQVESVITKQRTFKKLKADLEKELPLMPLDQRYVTVDIKRVRIFVDVQKLMEKPFAEIPVKLINAPEKYEAIVIPSTLSLVLEGGTDVLLNITKDDINAFLDYEKIKLSQEKDHPAYIIVPSGVRYRDVKPTRFRLQFIKRNR